ncbi:11394_t:CDS:2 [Funneliformis geosporum]|uniref:11394_t:CDS:1 n=1 Tax=Funneliformis geosporum TaxID=1117311 RepID=A0A9W4T075_9GLOM|nr:11394_t:CDS:2 [Funneliformis geosporum]
MVTHKIPENAQNGGMIPATDNNHFQENIHQPSLGHAIPCDQQKHPKHPNKTSIKNNNNCKNDRKVVLVENLVDTTAIIIDEIWYNFPVHFNSQVIPLRLFIQETLRRSRTSWSTLQTALFYLKKIKPQILYLWHNPDRWTLSSKDNNNQGSDPATCGRRMFLASLIIASKYLQDRNYANNAWSKICGLPVQEINSIERRFLKLIDYNLFIGEDMYKLWTNVLNSHIQAISGPEATAENQQAVAQFKQTLRLQPQAVECIVQG